MTSPPPDANEVMQAFRLGWALSELRGRYRPAIAPIRQPPGGIRTEHALPLADERSDGEQLIELHTLLTQLSTALKINGHIAVPGGGDQTYSARFAQLGATLRNQPTNGAWNELTENAYQWDAYIQDQLAINAARGAAYQLGRGLADTYWALDPDIQDESDWRSWQFLLGPRRCRTLARLIARLVEYVDPLTVPAVTSSLNAWAGVAADPERRREPECIPALYDQGLLWRDLIRSERQPEDLAAAVKPLSWVGIVWPVLKAFYLQIFIALVGAGGLAFTASELASGKSTKANTFFAILSGLGMTSAGLYARAKGVANSLVDQLKIALARDRAAAAANLAPKATRTLARAVGAQKTPKQLDSANPRMTELPAAQP